MIFAVRLFRLNIMIGLAAMGVAAGLGCATTGDIRQMEVTAYCGCSQCCSYEEGFVSRIIPFYSNRVVAAGPRKGKHYDGRTASGTFPRQYEPGLVSIDSVVHPWMIPLRIVIPVKIPRRKGTIAADTRYYPFGTKMYVPGYGWGVVEDRGSAIKGAKRLDIYFNSHQRALEWGRENVQVKIVQAG